MEYIFQQECIQEALEYWHRKIPHITRQVLTYLNLKINNDMYGEYLMIWKAYGHLQTLSSIVKSLQIIESGKIHAITARHNRKDLIKPISNY